MADLVIVLYLQMEIISQQSYCTLQVN